MLLDRSGQRECKPATVHASRVNRWPPNVDPRVCTRAADAGRWRLTVKVAAAVCVTTVRRSPSWRAVGVRTQVRWSPKWRLTQRSVKPFIWVHKWTHGRD